jgi:hypothetical protein
MPNILLRIEAKFEITSLSNFHFDLHLQSEGIWRSRNGKSRAGEWHSGKLIRWTTNEVFGNMPSKVSALQEEKRHKH